MTITFHPERGTILVCDFRGFIQPEMIKRRTVVVLSPQIGDRPGLCTIVPLSLTKPKIIKDYHLEVFFNPSLPFPYESASKWLKGDMIYAVSFSRLDLLYSCKDSFGKRVYDIRVLDDDVMRSIESCVLSGLGIKH